MAGSVQVTGRDAVAAPEIGRASFLDGPQLVLQRRRNHLKLDRF